MGPGYTVTNGDQLIAFTEPMAHRCCRLTSKEQTMSDGCANSIRSSLIHEREMQSNLVFEKRAPSQLVALGFQHSYKPCSYGRIGELQTRTDLERTKGKRNALDERSGMLEKRS